MSKNIVIQEGGTGKQLTVDKLKTNLVGGGVQLWVPEQEMGKKTITENGTYKASDDGYLGYSEVTVSGIGVATGTDGDGDDAMVYTDPITGGLVEEKLPTSIKVIDKPTNPYGIYMNGQTIVTDGMVCKAYKPDNSEYGTVPNNEITLNPTAAVYDPNTDTGGDSSVVFDGDFDWMDNFVQPLTISNNVICIASSGKYEYRRETSSSAYAVVMEVNGQYVGIIWLSTNSSYALSSVLTIKDTETGQETTTRSTYTLDNSTTTLVSGTTVYYAYGGDLGIPGQQIAPTPQRVENNAQKIATVIFDGTITQEQAGSHQRITVSWPRPGDGHVLETEFEILVAPPLGGED